MKVYYDFLKVYIGPFYAFIASLCSIGSLLLFFLKSELACIIALCVFCLGLFIILFGILRGIHKMIEQNSTEPYKRLSSFLMFQSNDGVTSTFEVFRMIQCKRLFLAAIPYNFKWTGSKIPELKSRIHSIELPRHNPDPNKWDEATIKFEKPLKYNECTMVNVQTENDDSDGKAKPWISCKLATPIDMLTFRVMLAYLPTDYNIPATFERKKIDAEVDGEFEAIKSISFDQAHKLYYHCVANPEPGYIYRLRWEKYEVIK